MAAGKYFSMGAKSRKLEAIGARVHMKGQFPHPTPGQLFLFPAAFTFTFSYDLSVAKRKVGEGIKIDVPMGEPLGQKGSVWWTGQLCLQAAVPHNSLYIYHCFQW